jgi:hypothetical protein
VTRGADRPDDRESIGKMLAYLLREGGMLVGVFGFLDASKLSDAERPKLLATVLVFTVLMVSAGMVLERTRRV